MSKDRPNKLGTCPFDDFHGVGCARFLQSGLDALFVDFISPVVDY